MDAGSSRPKLKISGENKKLAQANLQKRSGWEQGASCHNAGGENPSPVSAGQISHILNLDGFYNEYGAFKPSPDSRLKILQPRIKEVFWCLFTDTIHPEFGKDRPVLVLSPKNKLGTFSLVVPLTTVDQTGNDAAVKLSSNPNRNRNDDAWAVANHVYTVSHYRLRRFWDNTAKGLFTPRVSDKDFQAVLTKLHAVLPQPRSSAKPDGA